MTNEYDKPNSRERDYLDRRARFCNENPGRWIIVDPDWTRVYAAGPDVAPLAKEAVEKGCATPVAVRVPKATKT